MSEGEAVALMWFCTNMVLMLVAPIPQVQVREKNHEDNPPD